MFYKSSGLEYVQNDVDKIKNIYFKKIYNFVKKYVKKFCNVIFSYIS